ncbi:tagatose kinase [Pleomorphomonas carboxyditropha]|uniref:Sugar kinase n=1 Tax=Pleomorphomonas carboxyditropha TaxID=2023338 RepID=A0A2G9WPW6_9HYPH|nr:sugar kinase [Pleomorphomonas carboxyditropha]PIO96723.1 sugar kinase [Pleomorphomonas carboxyditropha]
MKKIVTAGEIVVEIMATEIGQTFLEPGRWAGPYPSGAPAIFISQAARLGQPCGMISSVGADDFGKLNLDRLRADGVDVSAIAVHADAVTGTAFVRYAADGSRAFIFNIPQSACGRIAIDAAAEALLAGADHFHVMGSSLFSDRVVEVVRAGIAAVKARGGTVSFDPNVRKEILGASGMRAALDAILEQTDLFLPSGPEIFLFAQAEDEAGAVAELLSRGISAVVVKKGAAGAAFHSRRESVEMPGFVVEEVDPTGAGDCFGAAFVTHWLRGLAPAEALRLANAAGALAVTRKGPMEGASSTAQIAAFLASAEIRKEAHA